MPIRDVDVEYYKPGGEFGRAKERAGGTIPLIAQLVGRIPANSPPRLSRGERSYTVRTEQQQMEHAWIGQQSDLRQVSECT